MKGGDELNVSIYNYYITPEEYKQAEKNGVDPHNLERRIRLLGWNKEKAINTPLENHTDRRKWAQVAKKNGIGYRTFMSRITLYGYSEEEAETKPLQNRKKIALKNTENNRVFPKKYLLLAEENGISYHTFYSRIKKYKWSFEKAATHPIMSHSEAGKLGKQAVINKYGDWNKVNLRR